MPLALVKRIPIVGFLRKTGAPAWLLSPALALIITTACATIATSAAAQNLAPIKNSALQFTLINGFAGNETQSMRIEKSSFGKTPEGQPVSLFTLTSPDGGQVTLTDYGAIITSVVVPDRDGNLANVNLGFDDLDGYLERHPFFGATVGRFCNRIAKGHFELDGKAYDLVINNGPNHLHGGTIGFDKQMWAAEEINEADRVGVRFSLTSPDGQEGYPGNLTVVAEYSWNAKHELAYTFTATTDQATVLNLTNHSYWNLGGSGSGDVRDHVVKVNATQYLAVDDSLIPTGEYASVVDTPLDFREMHRVGERIDQLPATKGYDHCFVVSGEAGELRPCGWVKDPESGRVMEVLTTQPGVQLYTGNHLSGKFGAHAGLCLETQHFPDSPNKPAFPTTVLRPGERFEQTTVHRFSIEE